VLVQGTGGVALFALQFARAAGARVVALTSSAEKAATLARMGAAAVIDYRRNPAWAKAVREATGGRGPEIIVETTGSSLDQSLAAVAFGGFIGVVGFLGGREAPIDLRHLIVPAVRVHGWWSDRAPDSKPCAAPWRCMKSGGNRQHLRPRETRAAFEHMRRAAHVGKIVIDLLGNTDYLSSSNFTRVTSLVAAGNTARTRMPTRRLPAVTPMILL